MRIVIIPSWYPSEEAPLAGVFVREQAQCLARWFDVTVLTPRFPALRDLLRLRWGPELIREEDGGLRTWRVRFLKTPTLRGRLPLLANADHVLVYYRKFAAAIRRGFARLVAEQGRPDVIHAHVVLPAGWIAVELGRIYGIPVVLTEHSGPFAMHLQAPKQRRLVRDILHGVDRVTAVSPALRDAMLDFCPGLPIEVIGNLIDTDFFTPVRRERSTRPFRFFSLGLHVEIKGFRFLLEAAHELTRQGVRDFELHLGGDGPLRSSLQKVARDLGIAERCRFLGMIDRSEVRAQMQACDVFVLPSLGETFGVVLGEAMACGKPVLATRCGGPEYVVTPQTGILISPGDALGLATAMAAFLGREHSFDPQRIRASVVERFGAEAFLEKTARVYDRAVCPSASRRVVVVGQG